MRILKPKSLHTGKWWDEPLTLVDGCTEVSEGCAHCWSRSIAKRFHRDWTPRFRADRLDIPIKARKPRVYAVWNDLLHEAVRFIDFIAAWRAMRDSPRHLFMVLTKRPDRLRYFLGLMLDKHGPPPNIALGVTVESQDHIGRVADLLAAWPGKTFVSVEPMLGEVDLSDWLNGCPEEDGYGGWQQTCPPLDLVICGGESGPGARPSHPDWFRGVRDQCEAAGVPFLFKQVGEWTEAVDNGPLPSNGAYVGTDGTVRTGDFEAETDAAMLHVPRKAAGRLLDGREHNGWFKEADE